MWQSNALDIGSREISAVEQDGTLCGLGLVRENPATEMSMNVSRGPTKNEANSL
jgi:hypothetical protein